MRLRTGIASSWAHIQTNWCCCGDSPADWQASVHREPQLTRGSCTLAGRTTKPEWRHSPSQDHAHPPAAGPTHSLAHRYHPSSTATEHEPALNQQINNPLTDESINK